MRHEHENARRHAYNTIAEANRHLDRGNIKNPRHHQMLTAMIKDATDTINNLDRMDDARPYSDTNIGYGRSARQSDKRQDDITNVVNDAMDAINRVLPRIADDDRYRMDYDRYDDDDDIRPVDQPRWRSARTGRFLPNLYGPSRVRRVRRRAEMDDMNDRYDDDMRYDDTQRTTDETRRMADEARRAADEARQAAYEARRTVDDTRNTSPVMRDDRNMRYDERRGDAEARFPRADDADDRTRRPGPETRR